MKFSEEIYYVLPVDPEESDYSFFGGFTLYVSLVSAYREDETFKTY